MEQWKVLIRDCLPSYITWEQYLANLRRLQENRTVAERPGLARNGSALLTGLVVCGRCGRRMHTTYSNRPAGYYGCVRHLLEAHAARCYGLSAAPVDTLVAQQVLLALEPAALELSLAAVQSVEQERARLHQHWKQQLERARYEAERAERQYNLVDPGNRLVARTLEQRWEQALREQRQLSDDYDRFLQTQPPDLTDDQRTQIRMLASNIPMLWDAPATTNADRKDIVRCLVDRVVVHVEPDSEYVDVAIHWQGGFTSAHQIKRRVRLYTQLRDYDRMMDRIEELRRSGHTVASIAAQLDADGFTPPMQGDRFEPVIVRKLMGRRGLADERVTEQLTQHEWWLADLAQHLEMPTSKLRDWACRGWVHARQTLAQKLWIPWADKAELARLRALNSGSARGANGYPDELTHPEPRPPRHGSGSTSCN